MADNDLAQYLDRTSNENRDKIQMLLFSGLDDMQVERINEYINQNKDTLYANVDDKNYCLTSIKNMDNIPEEYKNSFSYEAKSIDTNSSQYVLMGERDFLSKLLDNVRAINIYSMDKDIKNAFGNIDNFSNTNKENQQFDNDKAIDGRTVITAKEAKELNSQFKSVRFNGLNKDQIAATLCFCERHGYGMSFNPQDNVVNIYAKTEEELDKRTISVGYFLMKYDEKYGAKRDELDRKEKEENKNIGLGQYDNKSVNVAAILGIGATSYLAISQQAEEAERNSMIAMANKSIGDMRADLRNSYSNFEINQDGRSLREVIAAAKEENEREGMDYMHDSHERSQKDINIDRYDREDYR